MRRRSRHRHPLPCARIATRRHPAAPRRPEEGSTNQLACCFSQLQTAFSDRHLWVADVASGETREAERVDRAGGVAGERQVSGDLAEHRSQRQAVAAQAGHDGQPLRSGSPVDHRQAVGSEVNQTRPVARDSDAIELRDELGQPRKRPSPRVDSRRGVPVKYPVSVGWPVSNGASAVR